MYQSHAVHIDQSFNIATFSYLNVIKQKQKQNSKLNLIILLKSIYFEKIQLSNYKSYTKDT